MNAISRSFTGRKRIRRSFGRIPEVAPMPNLIDVQRASYEAFLQMNVQHDSRLHAGLQEVFKSVFPIDDFAGRGRLEFVYYELEEPKYDVEECIQRGMTYAAPLKVILRLIVWDVDEDTGARSIRDIKEQPVYMGDMPLMTDNGTFIINGTERVIVSQMHRSPGVFFDHDKGKTHSSGKYLFAARVIPYRGSWLDFEFDSKDLVYVRIDRKRKLPVTTLLYALEGTATVKLRAEREAKGETLEIGEIRGMDQEEILGNFYGQVVFDHTAKGWARPFDPDAFRGVKLLEPIVDAETGEVVADAEAKLTQRQARRIAEKTKEVLVGRTDLLGRFVAEDLVNDETGEIFAEAGEELTEPKLAALEEAGITKLPTLAVDQSCGPWIRNTLAVDKNSNRDDALIDIYRVMRPGEPPTPETAEALFRGLFFDGDRYDLSAVGRVKMNMRLGFDDVPDSIRVLRKEDLLRTVKILCELKDGRGQIDDIDNLGNRRVRSVGELMENQYRIGLLRMERAIRERMGSVDIDTVMPHDLINAKPAAAAVREFFGSSQLSQFMDQTNPLSEVTHKRRLSALGPGGLTRERAGFEVRDVHPTHYGRICPIETPEGPNIGLINSLATYAKVNKYGFIETPYMLVKDGVVQKEPRYLSAMEEEKLVVAQADAPMDGDGRFTEDLVSVRKQGDFRLARPEDVTAIDVSPKQLVSVAAALIPFLENDDANRALMGSNMQRQAVPLIQADAPLVGTGMEAAVARDSGATIIARRAGVVDQIDGARIVVRATNDDGTTKGVDIYRLRKFMRSNQSTCINQRPLVKVGDTVQERDHRRRTIDRARRAGAGAERAVRVHAVERLQLRGLDPDLRAHRARRRVHLDPHRGIRGDGARHQAGPGGDHARHPQRGRGSAEEPRRGRHRLYRRRSESGRHPGRQGHAEGRKPDDAGGKAAARDLRREGVGRARHVAEAAARCDRHGGGCARVQPPRRRQGRARDGDRARRDRASGEGPRRREGDPGAVVPQPAAREAAGPQGVRRVQGHQGRHADRRGRAGRASAWCLAPYRRAGRRGDGGDRDAEARVRCRGRPAAGAVRQQGGEAAARR